MQTLTGVGPITNGVIYILSYKPVHPIALNSELAHAQTEPNVTMMPHVMVEAAHLLTLDSGKETFLDYLVMRLLSDI